MAIAKDPVCGMEVDTTTSLLSSTLPMMRPVQVAAAGNIRTKTRRAVDVGETPALLGKLG